MSLRRSRSAPSGDSWQAPVFACVSCQTEQSLQTLTHQLLSFHEYLQTYKETFLGKRAGSDVLATAYNAYHDAVSRDVQQLLDTLLEFSSGEYSCATQEQEEDHSCVAEKTAPRSWWRLLF